MVFNEIDNFIEVYNNSVIELIQCFGTSFFGRIDHLASSVIKFRPKNSVPKPINIYYSKTTSKDSIALKPDESLAYAETIQLHLFVYNEVLS